MQIRQTGHDMTVTFRVLLRRVGAGKCTRGLEYVSLGTQVGDGFSTFVAFGTICDLDRESEIRGGVGR